MKHKTKRSGFLLIDKPEDMTSHDVVDRLRALTDIRKIGHAGTLDPFATGLLILAVTRQATKQIKHLMGLDKTYEATFVLGAASDTGDKTGDIRNIEAPTPDSKQIDKVIASFIGISEQRPPNYSAIKQKGKKLYELARAGEEINVPTRPINITTFERTGEIDKTSKTLSFPVKIHCASGTYVRALSRDLGAALETGGYTKELRRTDIGPFSIDEAIALEKLTKDNVKKFIKPVDKVLDKVENYTPLAKNPRG